MIQAMLSRVSMLVVCLAAASVRLFGQRYVRLSDSGAMFSGTAQTLNDLTSTMAYRVVDGFEARFEYRRDFSSKPYFPSPTADVLAKSQDTFTLGLLWCFGGKQGSW